MLYGSCNGRSPLGPRRVFGGSAQRCHGGLELADQPVLRRAGLLEVARRVRQRLNLRFERRDLLGALGELGEQARRIVAAAHGRAVHDRVLARAFVERCREQRLCTVVEHHGFVEHG